MPSQRDTLYEFVGIHTLLQFQHELNVAFYQVHQGLRLDGYSTVDAIGPWTNSCWKQISTCGDQGMTVAFWVG